MAQTGTLIPDVIQPSAHTPGVLTAALTDAPPRHLWRNGSDYLADERPQRTYSLPLN
jgi:hypothetical protein